MNTSVNGSRDSIPLNPLGGKIGKTFAYILIFVVSLVGNLFIAMVVFKTKKLRRPINFFIVNMAMSDLLSPIFLFPSELTKLYAGSWLISSPLGQALCKLVPFLADVSATVSIQSLVLIAGDRFVAVVFPLRSPLISPKLCPFFILVTWVFSMAFCWPYLFAQIGQLYCEMQWNNAFEEPSSIEKFFFITFFVLRYIAFALLIILYSVILIKLKSQKIPGEKSVNAKQQRARRNRNVLKMAIAIVLGFALCWLPFSFFSLQMFFANNSRLVHYWSITRFMAFSNGAINPCICFIFSGNYRQGFKNLFTGFRAVQE